MKKIAYGTAMLSILLMTACKDAPKADEAKTTEAKAVETPAPAANNVDLQKSSVQWVGTKPTGRHHGTVTLKEGNFKMDGDNIKAGHFVIDMNSIMAYDDDNSANDKLQGHLKSPDFFDAAKYGTAEFDITGVTAGAPADKNLIMKDATHTVTGNLKIKDVTKSISFPAKITVADNNKLMADAEFNLDRTLWGVSYKSDKSLGDKVINSDINFKIHIEATK
ncbi:MAG: YceI family protein [Flavipsychrobacter sp.]|nr:YceI family protein [Flavipsychrobacter sp.]